MFVFLVNLPGANKTTTQCWLHWKTRLLFYSPHAPSIGNSSLICGWVKRYASQYTCYLITRSCKVDLISFNLKCLYGIALFVFKVPQNSAGLHFDLSKGQKNTRCSSESQCMFYVYLYVCICCNIQVQEQNAYNVFSVFKLQRALCSLHFGSWNVEHLMDVQQEWEGGTHTELHLCE